MKIQRRCSKLEIQSNRTVKHLTEDKAQDKSKTNDKRQNIIQNMSSSNPSQLRNITNKALNYFKVRLY